MPPEFVRGPEPFWKTVAVIWKAARRRNAGRQRHRRQLRQKRKTGASPGLRALGQVVGLVFMGFVHGYLGFLTINLVRNGGEMTTIPATLANLRAAPPLAQLCATLALLWWFAMLVFQGEGLELDTQRRRHPMWEWLLSHPIQPEAAYLAEMISPLVTNPAYVTASVFWIIILSQIFDTGPALAGGLVIGLFFGITAAFLNKTVELCALLRLSMRSRGAVLGIMSWLGYAMLMLPIFGLQGKGLPHAVAQWLAPIAPNFHPNLLSWLLGNWSENNFSLALALTTSLGACLLLCAGGAALGRWSVAAGLEGGFDQAPQIPRLLSLSKPSRLIRDPLYRKELLWFLRDRSAVVQAVLIPLTIGLVQAFNLRNLMQSATRSWNGLCGLAVISGTYFLLVLGPRSLASEGPALWLTLTWPRGLEDLLKAKARLWWFLSSAVVFAVLLWAAFRFPASAWQVILVAFGWLIFSRSLAEKAVTLVTAPSSSGEVERLPQYRRWSAMLGTLAFGSGVATGNWHLAVIGVVFSSLSAAALWQNLRAHLPFLYDPWSEKVPTPPTLVHAMVAIAAMAEGIGLTTALLAAFATALAGRDAADIARTAAYGIGAVITFLIMQDFLRRRGVPLASIWRWKNDEALPARPALAWPLLAAGGIAVGGLLGVFAIGYRHLIAQLPAVQEMLRAHPELSNGPRHHLWWLALLTIGFAPPAEEFLFRGLLYRALDREWGGWRALLGNAAFFAIYHPPLSWLPVALFGLVSGVLFKKTGRLLPCVLSHAAYNAVVVLT